MVRFLLHFPVGWLRRPGVYDVCGVLFFILLHTVGHLLSPRKFESKNGSWHAGHRPLISGDASIVLDDVDVIVDEGQSSMSPRIQNPDTQRGRRDQSGRRSQIPALVLHGSLIQRITSDLHVGRLVIGGLRLLT